MTMNIGDPIPAVLGTAQHGQEITAASLAGRKVVLYFYPKDNTPGCTAEACSLRDHYATLQAAGYEVIGVSPDSAASHLRFIDKQQLPFRLIADTDKRLIEAMGVWGEKLMYGKTVMGLLRTTFLIDETGHIAHIFGPKQIKTKIHAEQILDLGTPIRDKNSMKKVV